MFQCLISCTCQLYCVFGSGSNHANHSKFIAQACFLNNWCKIGLLLEAVTCFEAWLYAINRLLWQKKALNAIVHGAVFSSVAMNSQMTLSLQDIEDEVFWKAIHVLLHAVFPALKALQYCDSNTSSMDKIYHLSKTAEDVILTSVH